MPEMFLKDIAAAVGGTINPSTPDGRYSHFHFDTREIKKPQTLFFALKTDASDGHDFIRQLGTIPGTGAVVSNDFDASGVTIPMIRVPDPLKAAHQLASHVRNTHRHIKYIGVTGSAGKTTTKEFIFQLLSHKYRAYRSFKNWNNWIGMPFSLLNLSGREETAIFELAMSFPGIGEIDLLAKILRPDAAVIINAYPVHLEFLKTIENVARAKCEMMNYLAADDLAFINGDCQPLVERLSANDAPQGHRVFFGCSNSINHIRLKNIQKKNNKTLMTIDCYGLEAFFETTMVNRVHIENLFTAIVVAQHLGMKYVEIQEALLDIQPLPDRGDIRQYGDITVIDETYNSNPEALKKTLDWVNLEYNNIKGKKIAILGDMLELGELEMTFHHHIGQFFARLSFDTLVTVGKRANEIANGAQEAGFNEKQIHRFVTATEAGQFLANTIENGSVLLFKASRGIRMENALQELVNELK